MQMFDPGLARPREGHGSQSTRGERLTDSKQTVTFTLNNGVRIPAVGLGVFQSSPGLMTLNAVTFALEVGYRHIDTAALYRNERDVGIAIRTSGIPRDQLFVTTKLWNSDHGYDQALRAFDASLSRLGLDYIDLFLIHWPVPEKRLETWTALERLYHEGRVRAIGVSNFTVGHLNELLDRCRVVPAVNQIEFSPFLYQEDVLEFCQSHGILVEGYSPLTKGQRLHDPDIVSIAMKYGRTPAQVLIRWCFQHGVVPLPKSVHPLRIESNLKIFDFELAEEDMVRLDSLNEEMHLSWDSTGVA